MATLLHRAIWIVADCPPFEVVVLVIGGKASTLGEAFGVLRQHEENLELNQYWLLFVPTLACLAPPWSVNLVAYLRRERRRK